jgi:imidazolonepropionase-like amidohydrolase
MRAVLAFHMRMTRALKDAGAKILLGTDTSNPFVVAGFAVHQELSLLVEAGLTPYEAIRAGTSDGADFLGAGDDFGRVRPGLRADLVLVDGNPLADVRAAARRSGVVLRGRWIPASDLDAQLENLAK